MYSLRTIATLAFIGLFGILTNPSIADAQNLRPWTVQNISGNVGHKLDGTASTIQEGDKIGIGSTISTGPKARIVLVRDSESITMSPKSEISIPDGTGSMLTRIIQNLGTLLLEVEKKSEQHFEVKTPYLAAIVKGTTFTVSVDQRGSAVHVVNGLVQVDDLASGQSGLVQPGRTGIVTSKPGGGLKISGGRSKRGATLAQATVEKTDATSADVTNDNGKAKKAVKKRNRKLKKATRKNSALAKAGKSKEGKKAKAKKRKNRKNRKSKKAGKHGKVGNGETGAKAQKGLTIATTINVAKIDISTVTSGLVEADQSSGSSADTAAKEDKESEQSAEKDKSKKEKGKTGKKGKGKKGGKKKGKGKAKGGNGKAKGGNGGGGAQVAATSNGNPGGGDSGGKKGGKKGGKAKIKKGGGGTNVGNPGGGGKVKARKNKRKKRKNRRKNRQKKNQS